MQDLTATMRHGITRKRSTKRLKYTGNLFRKNLIFHNLSYVLKHRLDIFFLFSVEQLLDNFSEMFSNHFFLMENLFLPSYIYLQKGLIFVILSRSFFFFFFCDFMQLLQHIIFRLYCCFFFIQSIEFIYGPSQFGFILWHL